MSTLQRVTGVSGVDVVRDVAPGPSILLSEWADDTSAPNMLGLAGLDRPQCPCGHPTSDCIDHFQLEE